MHAQRQYPFSSNPSRLPVESEGVNEDGIAVIEYTIDFAGKSEEEIALITDYIKYMEYLAKWDGKLPTVMNGDGASIMIPVDPEA